MLSLFVHIQIYCLILDMGWAAKYVVNHLKYLILKKLNLYNNKFALSFSGPTSSVHLHVLVMINS